MDMGLGRDIKVNAVIRDGAWNLPRAAFHQLMEIFDLISAFCSPHADFDDEVIWSCSDTGQFGLKFAVTEDRSPYQAHLLDMIWFKGKIQKHAICL